ncbi:hypothetical protein GGH99_005454 [Coemansia sp. RSA 1285]|nr:hypothetical protein GGH99_005454 [Coemansia sp. RSA 1285]
MIDEREESLREMVSLGNIKAISAYIRGGVNINSQNKMNGWTALHWACARGNLAAAELLVRFGADTTLTNDKGQTPLDICRDDNIRTLLSTHGQGKGDNSGSGSVTVSDKEPKESSKPLFVPNYMANPDLSKAWGIPDDAMPAAQGESGYIQQLQYEASMSKSSSSYNQKGSSNAAASNPSPVAGHADRPQEQEILVYDKKYDEANLLGSVFIDPCKQTIGELKLQLAEEIDGVPAYGEFTLARYNGKQTIPIGAKQETFSVEKVFRGPDEAVVVLCKNEALDK